MDAKITERIQVLLFSFLIIFPFISKQIKSLDDTPYFTFPVAIILSNDNIFVIHESGVSIYDPSSNLISNVVEFTNSEKISDYSFLQVTISQFENDYIIAVINYMIYFFDYKGSFIYKTNGYFSYVNLGLYYKIVPIKFYNGYFFYILIFEDTRYLYINYYKFDLINRQNNEIHSYLVNVDANNMLNSIIEYGLTCELMSYNFNEKILSCFFIFQSEQKYIYFYDYLIRETELVKINERSVNPINKELKCIKSDSNNDGSKAFICFYDIDKTCNCFKYDTSDISSLTPSIELKTMFTNRCDIKYYSMKVGYIKRKEEFFISSLSNENTLLIQIYDNNFNLILNNEKYMNCTFIKAYSIFYSFKSNEYYDFSDLECRGKKYTLNILTKDIEYPVETTTPITFTTILTTIIENNNPTTIIENNIPSTIIENNIPTTIIENNIPTTIIENNLQTTIIENIIPTTLIETNIPTTYVDTILLKSDELINEEEESTCEKLEKCSKCNEESISKNLCIKCNSKKGFYFLNYGSSYESISYIDCVNKDTKPSGYYFNENTKSYELCYYSCSTCDYGGNTFENNCTSCEVDHLINKRKGDTMNCDTKCTYFYYYIMGNINVLLHFIAQMILVFLLKIKWNALMIVQKIVNININIMANAYRNVQIIP